MTVPAWAWALTIALFAVLIAADFTLARGSGGRLRGAGVLSGLWIAAGLGFGALLWWWQGADFAEAYLASYLLEKALSVDNIFVFVLLFASLAVPPGLQRRVLYYGVAGALVSRGAVIAAGGALIEQVSWVFYGFGALVLLAAVRMFRSQPIADPGNSLVVRGLRRVLPVTPGYVGGRFLVRAGGAIMATPLLVALVAVEVTDLVFALDSIPAIFGITRNVFVVFTSNAFAVLGLRALYFVLVGSMHRFFYLRHALGVLLALTGIKMLLTPWVHLPVSVTLAVIVAVIGGAVGASLWRDRARSRAGEAEQKGCPVGEPRTPAWR
jgi:tellurite resistance protein TerC